MNVTLFGGPLDGLTIDMPEAVDKIAVLDDRGRLHRYETDGEWTQIKHAPNGETVESGADMRLTGNADEYDAELREAMGSGWKDLI